MSEQGTYLRRGDHAGSYWCGREDKYLRSSMAERGDVPIKDIVRHVARMLGRSEGSVYARWLRLKAHDAGRIRPVEMEDWRRDEPK